MNWFVIVVIAICLLIQQYLFAIVVVIAYWLWWLATESSGQDNQKSQQEDTHSSKGEQDLSSGDLADLVLLRLELQSLTKLGQIDSEQQAHLNRQIDTLCTVYLSDLKATRHNTLWKKHRDDAWELLNQFADMPLGLPPWRIPNSHYEKTATTAPQPDFPEPIQLEIPITLEHHQLQATHFSTDIDLISKPQPSEPVTTFATPKPPIPATPLANESQTTYSATTIKGESQPSKPITPQEAPIPSTKLTNDTSQIPAANFLVSSESAETFTIPEVSIPATPLANELNTATPVSLIVETDFSTPINPFTDKNSDTTASEQAATFTIDEVDHSSALPAKTISPEPTLNQYAWKPHEPTRLERVLKTVSGWHSMAVPFLAQNIGWFIGVFCFIAGSMFLVSYASGYQKNLIAFFALFIFTIGLLFGGYQLRQKRPELEVSSYVIFILSLLLIPLTNIACTQLLMSSNGSFLKFLFSGFLVLAAIGIFYFAVTLVAGLMDRSLQQSLPKFFLALTATQLLQVLLQGLPFWQLLIVIHLLIFALLSVSIYLFANQWLQSIFVDQHKIAYFAAGTLIYAAVVSFVFITASNSIVLPTGYYGFFLMLLCGLLFFIDAQLKQWIEQHAYLSRFSFLVYGLSVLALCLVANHPIAIPTLILAIALYAFIVWRYLTLTPLTILLACYFWLYGSLVLQALPNSWHFLASLPVLFSLYKAAHWALNKRQSAYLAVIIYRVLYSLLAGLTVWSLYQSDAGPLAMATAITASVLVYYTLKAAPVAIFSSYAKIASSDEDVINCLSKKHNLLSSHWFYTIPILGAVTIYYTPRLPLLAEQAQFSLGLSLMSIFWAYRGLNAFFKANSSSETTAIEQCLNSTLLSLLVGVLPLWMLTDNIQRVAPLFVVAIILLWLSYQLLTRWLFYLTLLTFALAYLPLKPLKALYFPSPSGLGIMLLGISLWFWLWYSERQEASELTALKREQVTQKHELLPSCQLLSWYRLPSSATLFRDVIAAPLEQVMCLLWLLGMKTLYERLFDSQQFSNALLVAFFLAALFGLLLIVRYSLIKLLALPIALLLTAVLLTLFTFWQLNAQSLLLASLLFAVAVWQSVNYTLERPFFIKLAETLNPTLPNEIGQIGLITHYAAFFIVIVGIISQLVIADGHSRIVLLSLLSTAVFLWLSNRMYPDAIVRYLVLGFSVLAGIELISLTLHSFTWQTLTTDNYAALMFVSLSLAVAGLSIPITSYDKPSTSTAVLLVFIGIFLQLLHSVQITALIVPLDYSVLFLAGFSLLLANAKRKWALYNFSAFMIVVLAILWLENSLFHAKQPFSLWLNAPFANVWLVLGLLSLTITVLSQCLKSGKILDVCYLPPLNTVATLCFVWSLLGTLTLFFASAGHADLLAWIFLILLLALFPLSKNRSGATQIRGFGSACLATLSIFSLLGIGKDGLMILQTLTVLWSYALWLIASFVLPRFNKRYTDWTVEPIFLPYLGFLLTALSGLQLLIFDDFSQGVYCLELTIYSVLMFRYSRWQGFAWLANFAFVGAMLWLENSTLHIYQPLSLWLSTHTFANLWLVLGLLSLTMSMLSHKLKATQAWAAVYCVPLTTVATLCFAWSLLGTLTVFFTSLEHSILLACVLLTLLLALFSLSKDSSYAAQTRGFGSACLLTLTAFSLLPVGLDGFILQPATVLLGYTLWLFASFVLPPFNKRYRGWTVEPIFFPYLGFLLVTFSSYWLSSFTDFSIGIYCLELTIYCVLMWRYSYWQGFAWLANFAFVGAALCLENSFVHPNQTLVLLLGDQKLLGSWLILGLLSLSLSMLSHRLKAWQIWEEVYYLPLSSVATLCFAGSLLGTLSLLFMGSSHGVVLAGILLVLLFASFSLSKDSADAVKVRGFATANFLTLIAFSLLPSGLNGFALQITTALFGYTLWLLATIVLPRFNQRYSVWTIAPNFFPWLGLLLVLFSAAWWREFNAIEIGIYCLELSVYALLMLRYSNWREFSWLSAFAFTAAGVFFFNIDNDFLAFKLLLWSNLQLLMATFWQRKGEKLAERWQWQSPPLAQAFTNTAQFIFVGYLLITSISIESLLVDSVHKPLVTSVDLLIFILINLSFLHLLWVRFSSFSLHSFIYSLFLSVWAIYFTYLNTLFQPPLLIALWSIVLLAIRKIRIAKHTNEINNAVGYWLHGSVIAATLSLLTYNGGAAMGELLLALAMVAGLSAALAGKSTNSVWLILARIEFLLVLHAWPCLLVGYNAHTLQLLLPWYALQSTLLAVLSMAFLKHLLTTPMNDEDNAYYTQALQGTSWLIALGLVQLLSHGILVQQTIMAGTTPNWLFAPFDATAAFSAGVIISLIAVRHVRHTPDSNWLYGIVMLVSALAFYGRLLWLGADSINLWVWDTAAIIGFAYILFFLQGLFPSKPLYNTALFMPVLALFTVPLQLAKPETSMTLIATGLLYVMVRRHTQQKIPLYLALLAFNAGVYLWVPSLAKQSQLIQVYVIPAALSVLMLLHLHSRELKPSVLMGSRLAALSSIYACATADVFLSAEAQQLSVFILAMVLSMVGILLGIALRTRAFLYAGVSFLLLNVLGQLRLPQQETGKAIVLMVMGAIITGFMIWFSIKRVEILQRISAIQAKMETWE